MLSNIWLGHGILNEKIFAQKLRNIGSRFAVILDERVAELFQGALASHELDLHFFTFAPGELSKTRETKARLEDALFEAGFGRTCAIIAIGGGVAMDLGGFIAATFCRGVPHVLIPTTLMGMVDASIGGKTAVNTTYGKNLIGAYYLPKLTIVDLQTLDSLPEREMRSGMVEVIKYGLTLDPSLLETSDPEILVRKSIAIKEAIISRDFLERGERRILNFGHTVGHAIESVENYRLSHGEAIAIGMVVESLMSARLGFLKDASLQKIVKTLHPYLLPYRRNASELLDAISHDKKGARFVVLEEIGKVHPCGGNYCLDLQPEILEEALQKYDTLVCQAKPA